MHVKNIAEYLEVGKERATWSQNCGHCAKITEPLNKRFTALCSIRGVRIGKIRDWEFRTGSGRKLQNPEMKMTGVSRRVLIGEDGNFSIMPCEIPVDEPVGRYFMSYF